MTAYHGKNAGVLLDALDITTYLNSADLSVEVDTADSDTFGASWKSSVPGLVGAKLETGGIYDPALGKFTPAMLAASGSLLTYGPAGLSTAGQAARLFPVVSTAYAESSPVGGLIGIKWSAMSDGAVGFGHVLSPLGAQTSVYTGAGLDGGAQTTTGWQAHLHVTAVTGGSWVVKLVDDSASNFGTVADLSGGAFTAATGATQQRLLGASGATVRRYVRCVATRTGGAGGDTITFALAFARNN